MFPTVQESEKRSLRTFKRYWIDVADVSDRLLFVSNRLVSRWLCIETTEEQPLIQVDKIAWPYNVFQFKESSNSARSFQYLMDPWSTNWHYELTDFAIIRDLIWTTDFFAASCGFIRYFIVIFFSCVAWRTQVDLLDQADSTDSSSCSKYPSFCRSCSLSHSR